MSDPVFIVMSGLPASGKSTLARRIGERLTFPVIDKDRILEALFDTLGVGDQAWRTRLSRASDEVLVATSETARRAVLDNWWHREWAVPRLRQLGGLLIEVHCACDVEVASERFRARRRHPGHLDQVLTEEEAEERIARVRASFRGPLGLGGPLLVVDTNRPVDVGELVAGIRPWITEG
ncbi:AAA family ATPase [Longispora sp. NPDC051575]|uniref:AAA family ATPase n=1 Tax=Longispora sp. NPDC051575 TaxID=3154943 RepID=UPI003427C739